MAKYRRMPIDELDVDASYQRDLNQRHVAKIVAEFDRSLLGVLEVSQRNGRCAVVDGQHRLAALAELGKTEAPCLVHEGLTAEEEASLFVRYQDGRKPLLPVARFKALLRSGNENAIAIQRVVEANGYQVGTGTDSATKWRNIGGVRALEAVYGRGGEELLDGALKLLSVYHDEPQGNSAHLIGGFAVAIERYSGHKNWDRIVPALEGITPRSILRKAASMSETGTTGRRDTAIAQVVAGLIGIRGPYKRRPKGES